MVGKVILFPLNAATGAVRVAVNVTTGTARLVGGVVERTMGVSRTPSEEPRYEAPSAPAETSSPRAPERVPPRAPEPTTDPTPEAPSAPAAEPSAPEPEAGAESGAAPEPSAAEPAADYDASPPTPLDRAEEVAKTIDDRPELVGEFAERGAEDGAGASATVEEPWEGYADMHADAVIARIGEADLAELAVVELYEQLHRKRQTVLEAAERRLKALSGPGSGG